MLATILALFMSATVPTNGRWIRVVTLDYITLDYWSVARVHQYLYQKELDIWVRGSTKIYGDSIISKNRVHIDCNEITYNNAPVDPDSPTYTLVANVCNTFF